METITLELRPRLCSLSAYIFLKNNIDASAVTVKLLENTIELSIEEEKFNLSLQNVKLKPSSLSSLRVANFWISFRIQTQPNSIYGTFETEVIKTEDNNIISGSNNVLSKINLPSKNKDCVLLCTCCKKEITKITSFHRILPLPSIDCDPQEWFCHSHSAEGNISLEPKENDLFYAVNYCLLHKNNYYEKLKLKSGLVYCDRCLSILGSQIEKNLSSFKFWNCCIEYKILEDNSIIKGCTDPLSDFLITVKDASDLVIGEKLLIEAYDGNNIHYIFLRPMELKLNCFSGKITKDRKLNFESSTVTKVFYKCGESKNSQKQTDSEMKYCEVAFSSILAGMETLISSSKRFPPAYRQIEDFYIGYLPM